MKKSKQICTNIRIEKSAYAHVKEVAKYTKLTMSKVLTVLVVSFMLRNPDLCKKEQK